MTAADILTTLARSSAQAGALALLILVAQVVFRRQLPPRWRCALWLLVAARLCVPVSLSSAASLFNLVPPLTCPAPSRVSDPAYRAATSAPSPAPVSSSEANRADSSRRSSAKAEPVLAKPQRSSSGATSPTPFNRPRLLLGIWLAGVVTTLSCLLLSTVVLARRFRTARCVDDPAIAGLLLTAQRRLGRAAAPLPIFECDRLGSPALHGCWRPRLLLPAGFTRKFSSAELGYVFLHELAHVRRRDLPVNWLLALLTAAHWFNPLVWLAFARWRADRELACDALALEAAGPGHNVAYGRTILRILEDYVPQRLAPGLVGILEDKHLLCQRISQIASFAPRRRWPVTALALTAGLALVGLTDAQVAAPTTPPLSAAAILDREYAVVPNVGSVRRPTASETLTKSFHLDVENPSAATRAEVARAFPEMKPDEKNAVLSELWPKVRCPEFIEVLLPLANNPDAPPEMSLEYFPGERLSLTDMAVLGLLDLKPETVRPMILENIRLPHPSLRITVLRALPDKELPELDSFFLEQLANISAEERASWQTVNINVPRSNLFVLAPLIERYASARIVSQVLTFYAPMEGRYDCATQAAFLRFWLKHDRPAGLQAVERALSHRQDPRDSGCYRDLLGDTLAIPLWDDVETNIGAVFNLHGGVTLPGPLATDAETLVLKHIHDPDKDVAEGALELLARFGTTNGREVLIKLLTEHPGGTGQDEWATGYRDVVLEGLSEATHSKPTPDQQRQIALLLTPRERAEYEKLTPP